MSPASDWLLDTGVSVHGVALSRLDGVLVIEHRTVRQRAVFDKAAVVNGLTAADVLAADVDAAPVWQRTWLETTFRADSDSHSD